MPNLDDIENDLVTLDQIKFVEVDDILGREVVLPKKELLQKIIEDQKCFNLLDSNPITLTAKAHRPAYGTDGDYFSKPSSDDIIENQGKNPKKQGLKGFFSWLDQYI